MATVAKAKARKLGLPIQAYPKPDYWLPHFINCLNLKEKK